MINQSSQLCFSVEVFFRSNNWEGQSLEDTKQSDRHLLQSSWQCLPVENFLIAGNWEGQIIARSPTQSQQPWQCSSVNSFFSTCNWEGYSIHQNLLNEPSSWCTQKVTDFIQFIRWEGKTEIGALPKEWLASKSITVFEVAPALSLTELF
ncbi:hypothetical protein ABN584_15255 [Gloeocapsa sp. BRSZ]